MKQTILGLTIAVIGALVAVWAWEAMSTADLQPAFEWMNQNAPSIHLHADTDPRITVGVLAFIWIIAALFDSKKRR